MCPCQCPAATAPKLLLCLLFPKVWDLVLGSSWNKSPPVRAAFLCSHCTGLTCSAIHRCGRREGSEISKKTPRVRQQLGNPVSESLSFVVLFLTAKKPQKYYPKAVRVVQTPFPNTACRFPGGMKHHSPQGTLLPLVASRRASWQYPKEIQSRHILLWGISTSALP